MDNRTWVDSTFVLSTSWSWAIIAYEGERHEVETVNVSHVARCNNDRGTNVAMKKLTCLHTIKQGFGPHVSLSGIANPVGHEVKFRACHFRMFYLHVSKSENMYCSTDAATVEHANRCVRG